jgi:hypothetical protein
MAERRMFALKIIDSDAFLDMPQSTQNLYFHLSMRADDDGFISNPKKIMRMIVASDDDLRILAAKRFILTFDTGIVVIKHWRIHNYIAKDRYTPTIYKEEKEKLFLKSNGSYTDHPEGDNELYTKCIQNDDTGKVRLGKVRLGKVRLGKVRLGKVSKDSASPDGDDESFTEDSVPEKPKEEISAAALSNAQLLADLHKQNVDQGYKINSAYVKKWAEDIDKINRIDGRSWDDIEKVMRWCKSDPFWRSNIISGKKFREKFTQLIGKMNDNHSSQSYYKPKYREEHGVLRKIIPEKKKGDASENSELPDGVLF